MKKLKWIDTRYAKPYKTRRAIAYLQMHGMSLSCAALVANIQSTIANTPENKIGKAFAVAQAVTANARAQAKLLENLRHPQC